MSIVTAILKTPPLLSPTVAQLHIPLTSGEGEAITEEATAPLLAVSPPFCRFDPSFPPVSYLSCIFLAITPIPLCSRHIP